MLKTHQESEKNSWLARKEYKESIRMRWGEKTNLQMECIWDWGLSGKERQKSEKEGDRNDLVNW